MAREEDRLAEVQKENLRRQQAAVDHRESVKQQQVDEFYAREAAAQPTPTQRENDLAKVGALDIDNKEDDGSEWQSDFDQRVMTARLSANNPYDTRAIEAGEESSGSSEEAPRRGRRRAASDE
jgi:hypothetical protein